MTQEDAARVVKPTEPKHPFWCDDCGGKAGFTIPECPIDHEAWCQRHGEDPAAVYAAAVAYVRATGKAIP